MNKYASLYFSVFSMAAEDNKIKKNTDTAAGWAISANDYIEFNTPEEAEWFSKRYKSA